MARPRVFISSTYYDLKSIRAELENFINTLGYEGIRHEMGHIPYGSENRPETYAIKEIETCDILVSIIGGKFGTQASGSSYSISQKELKKAHDEGKQLFIFIEKSVHAEFNYYKINKDVPGVRYTAIDNVKVYEFLEEIYQLPRGNPIFAFETGLEITAILREQWAGLMQRLLSEHSNKTQASVLEELQRSLQTVDKIVQFLREENDRGSAVLNEIIFSNHPLFAALRAATRTRYRLYFTNLSELNTWAESARNFTEVSEENWDNPDYREWVRDYPTKDKKEIQILFIKKDLFDVDGNLRPLSTGQWHDDWLRIERRDVEDQPIQVPDIDDIPF